MSISNLHTLERLLTVGVDIPATDNEDGFNRYPIAGILIPRIQRPYAQGRRDKNVQDIRRDFVEDLLSAVSSEEERPIELSFIFGSLQKVNWDDPRGYDQALELLDGQQRLTTLFLFHWYLYKKECPNDMPCWLSRFRYETRDSSTTFLSMLTAETSAIDLNENVEDAETKLSRKIKPSEAITGLIWFNNDFRCDTTVMSMLCMLDEIDLQYKTLDKECKTLEHSLHKNLGRIQFYIRLLLGFDMPDLLFIKMNSRGLPLIPFENFKADIIKYMEKAKKYDEKVSGLEVKTSPFHFYFASQIDTKWVYLFWSRPDTPQKGSIIELNDKRTGARFFRFFNRMLFTKLAVDYAEAEDPYTKTNLEAACEFFRSVPEISMEEHLTDWNTRYVPAISIWEGNKDYFRECSKVLNVLCDNYASGFNLREAIVKSPFFATSNFEIYSKVYEANGDFTYAHRIIFSVIVDFILNIPASESIETTAIAENLRRLIRVLHNVIEHSEIDKTNILELIKAFHKIIIAAKEVQSGDFYAALANYNGDFAWLKAESAKAEDICRDANFEGVMIRAEEHPILRGRLTPIYEARKMTVEQLSLRVEEFYRIFPVDEKGICRGIAAEYAQEDSHLLIRAMMSYLTDWEKLNGIYVTERGFVIQGTPVNSKYLSNLLFGKGKVESLFIEFFAKYFGNTDFKVYLSNVLKNASNYGIVNDGTRDVYKRLVTDTDSYKLYNWIKSREKDRPGKEPVVRWLRDAGILNYDGTNSDRLVLTTPRRFVIPTIMNLTGALFEDKHQEGHVERFGEFFAYDVVIIKSINIKSGQTIDIKSIFYPNGSCKICVNSSSSEIQSALKENGFKDVYFSYKEESSTQVIANKINEWSEKLQTID